MAKSIEDRVSTLEEYWEMFYKWIDELRTMTKELQKSQVESIKRQEMMEQNLIKLSDIQVDTARILKGMNGKLNDHKTN